MIRSIKDEMLPAMRRETQGGLNSINDRLKNIEGSLMKHENRILALENYKASADGGMSVWKFVISIVGVSSIMQWYKLLIHS